MLAPFFVSLLACFAPETEAPVDSSGQDTGEPEDEQQDLDPLVDSYFPANYAPADPARVVYLGDSITAGNGASSPMLTYVHLLKKNDDDTWTESAELDLTGLYGELPEIIDQSLAGATTSSMISQQLPKVTDELGDTVSGTTVVMVTIAGNDVQRLLYNTSGTDAAIETILEKLGDLYDYFEDPERFPDGSYVYLANVYEPSDGVGQADECFYGMNLENVLPSLDAVNAATRAQAEERGVAWIDLRGHFLGHGFNGGDSENPYYEADDPSLWFADDCIHPNDRGHHELRRLFWYAVAGEVFPGDVPIAE